MAGVDDAEGNDKVCPVVDFGVEDLYDRRRGEHVSGILVRPRKAKSRRWFVYILKCRDGTLYTGITNDLARREAEHNSGTASRYTRSRRPVQIIYEEPCPNRSAALKKEYAVKSLTRKEKEDYIDRHAKKLRVLQK